MFEKFWANIIRYYTNKVRLRGITQNQGFLIHVGGFCLLPGQNTSVRIRLEPHLVRLLSKGQNDAQSQNLESIAIPGIPKALTRDRLIEFIDSTNPFNRGTVIQLNYTHNNILNSQLQAQAYYRQTRTVAPLFDLRVFSTDSPLGVNRSVVTSERFGVCTSCHRSSTEIPEKNIEMVTFYLLKSQIYLVSNPYHQK